MVDLGKSLVLFVCLFLHLKAGSKANKNMHLRRYFIYFWKSPLHVTCFCTPQERAGEKEVPEGAREKDGCGLASPEPPAWGPEAEAIPELPDGRIRGPPCQAFAAGSPGMTPPLSPPLGHCRGLCLPLCPSPCL